MSEYIEFLKPHMINFPVGSQKSWFIDKKSFFIFLKKQKHWLILPNELTRPE